MHAAVVEGQGTFYIGIIDILQEWNYDKWYERMFKKYVLRKDANGLSAMDPLNYRKRFYQRAVLDVFDGLDMEDADDADIFERSSDAYFPGEPSDRDTVDTAISGARHKVNRATLDSSNGSIVGRGTFVAEASMTGGLPVAPTGGHLLTTGSPTAGGTPVRPSDVDFSESSSFSHEVQLRSFPSSNASRDSTHLSPLGTDRRFQVKPITK